MSLFNILELAWSAIQYATENQTPEQPLIVAPPQKPVAKPGIGHMQMSKAGIIELGDYEALSNTCYYDSVRVKTVSIGLTRSDIKDIDKWPWDKFLTDEQAVKLYVQKLQHYVDAVNSELKVEVEQHQFDALVSITYNIGTGDLIRNRGGLAGSTFIDRVNNRESPQRVVEAMARWNKAGGRVLKGLINRRAKEARLYRDGYYQNNGTVGRIVVNPHTHLPKYSGRVNIEQYI
jgi:lysozyme